MNQANELAPKADLIDSPPRINQGLDLLEVLCAFGDDFAEQLEAEHGRSNVTQDREPL